MNDDRRKLPWLAGMTLLLILLMACTAPAEEPPAQETEPVQVTTEPATPTIVDMDDVTEDASEQETTREMPEEIPAPGIPDPEAYMTEQARLALADRLSIAVETITVANVEERQWSNAALGCAESGQMYAQVITPGFEITLTADGETYVYHSDMNSALVLCGADGQPVERTEVSSAGDGARVIEAVTPAQVDLGKVTPEPSPEDETLHEIAPPGVPDSSNIVANTAAQKLANELGIDAGEVQIITVERVEWRDSSLGCGRPGQNYMMVITPGYRIVLEANGEEYVFHSDMQGNMVQCHGAESGDSGVVR